MRRTRNLFSTAVISAVGLAACTTSKASEAGSTSRSTQRQSPTTYVRTQRGAARFGQPVLIDGPVWFRATSCADAVEFLGGSLPTGDEGACFTEIGVDDSGDPIDPSTEPVRPVGSIVGGDLPKPNSTNVSETVAASKYLVTCVAEVPGTEWEEPEEGVLESMDGGIALGIERNGHVVTVSQLYDDVWKAYWRDGSAVDGRMITCALYASTQDAVTSAVTDELTIGAND